MSLRSCMYFAFQVTFFFWLQDMTTITKAAFMHAHIWTKAAKQAWMCMPAFTRSYVCVCVCVCVCERERERERDLPHCRRMSNVELFDYHPSKRNFVHFKKITNDK